MAGAKVKLFQPYYNISILANALLYVTPFT